jgi:Tfp pilus assembly protein PilF
MQRGDWSSALPLLQAAVRGLAGVGPSDPYEGYANYNLGYTLVQLGQCSQAMTYLQRADRLEPGNHDVHTALDRARRC